MTYHWDNVFSSSSRFSKYLDSNQRRRIVPNQIPTEFSIADILKIIYDAKEAQFILRYKDQTPLKFNYNDFLELITYIKDSVSEGWCDEQFYIGEDIYVDYSNENESQILAIRDDKNKKYTMILYGNDLNVVILKKYEMYDFVCNLWNLRVMDVFK